jgi:hypothetical protein
MPWQQPQQPDKMDAILSNYFPKDAARKLRKRVADELQLSWDALHNAAEGDKEWEMFEDMAKKEGTNFAERAAMNRPLKLMRNSTYLQV